MSLKFVKFHGFGNDYIVIEQASVAEGTDLSDLAIRICDRHTGAGGDGIAVLTQAGNGSSNDPVSSGNEADYFCEIVNPDGSIAGFSGNGTRCAVAYLYYSGLWHHTSLRLGTRSGVKNYSLIERKGKGEFWLDAEIGKPRFSSEQIPVVTSVNRAAVVGEPIRIDGHDYSFSAVNVGNPVAGIFVDTFDLDWRSVGRSMEVHEVFPQKANIVFIKVTDRENIEVRIWERAAGETSSSGTCCSAAAVMSAFSMKTDRVVDVKSPGGVTKVTWQDDDTIIIRGRADLAYSGEWPA